MAKVVLEGIGDPPIVETDVGRSLVMVDVVPDHFLEHPIEFAIVAEDDVAALVPQETLRIHVGGGVTTHVVVPLADDPVVMAESAQFAAAAQAARTCADDDDPRYICHGNRPLSILYRPSL